MFGKLKNLFGGDSGIEITAPVAGKVVALEDVPDPTFAQGILGPGIAIEPAEGRIVAPADGTVDVMFETGHAVSLTTADGAELLIHVGIDTVQLEGKHYKACCKAGDQVSKGDTLIEFDPAAIKAEGYQIVKSCATRAHHGRRRRSLLHGSEDVPDPTFAQGILGPGIAIEPSEGRITAPADGSIDVMFETGHAVSMTTADGAELLIHVGIDTVQLEGKHYKACCKAGQQVKKGDVLIEFDPAAIKAEGYQIVTPILVCNPDAFTVEPAAGGTVAAGDALLTLKKK